MQSTLNPSASGIDQTTGDNFLEGKVGSALIGAIDNRQRGEMTKSARYSLRNLAALVYCCRVRISAPRVWRFVFRVLLVGCFCGDIKAPPYPQELVEPFQFIYLTLLHQIR